jgi:hypothetical protein
MITVPRGRQEVEDAVAARVEARQEGGPRRRGERRVYRVEKARGAFRPHAREVGKKSRFQHGPDDVERPAVDAEYEDAAFHAFSSSAGVRSSYRKAATSAPASA